MLKSAKPSPATWLGLALAAGMSAASASALAQTVDELTVTGRLGDARSLSAGVSYADLDLTTREGRDILGERVRATARDLCRELGESDVGASAMTPSCEQDAIASVAEQQRIAFAQAVPRAYAAAPPSEPYVAALGANGDDDAAAPAAESYGQTASAEAPSVTSETVTNGPVPDTVANRRRFGGPMSDGGRLTTPAGN